MSRYQKQTRYKQQKPHKIEPKIQQKEEQEPIERPVLIRTEGKKRIEVYKYRL